MACLSFYRVYSLKTRGKFKQFLTLPFFIFVVLIPEIEINRLEMVWTFDWPCCGNCVWMKTKYIIIRLFSCVVSRPHSSYTTLLTSIDFDREKPDSCALSSMKWCLSFLDMLRLIWSFVYAWIKNYWKLKARRKLNFAWSSDSMNLKAANSPVSQSDQGPRSKMSSKIWWSFADSSPSFRMNPT